MKNQTSKLNLVLILNWKLLFKLRGCSRIGLVDLKNDLLVVWLIGCLLDYWLIVLFLLQLENERRTSETNSKIRLEKLSNDLLKLYVQLNGIKQLQEEKGTPVRVQDDGQFWKDVRKRHGFMDTLNSSKSGVHFKPNSLLFRTHKAYFRWSGTGSSL